MHDVVEETLHKHDVRVALPRPAQVSVHAGEIFACRHIAVLEGESRAMIGTIAALGGDDVVPSIRWAAREEEAVLEHGLGIAGHEVHRSGDLALPVELEVILGEECVLESLQLAAIKHRFF